MEDKKKMNRLSSIFLLLFSVSLSAVYSQSADTSATAAVKAAANTAAEVKVEAEIKVITDMQDRYNALPETVGAVCILPASGTSSVPAELLKEFERNLLRQLTVQGKVKPISMNKYLTSAFQNRKAAHPFALIQSLADERYTVPLQLICKPWIFRSGQTYVIRLAFYRLKGSVYPVEVVRTFTDPSLLIREIDSCLAEFADRYFSDAAASGQKRVLIKDFSLEFRKLVELASGEFDFITAPFIQQEDASLKSGDDYFGMLLGFVLSSTGMFETFRLADFRDFAETNMSTYSGADYIISGRVQLTEQLCFLYIDAFDAKRGTKVISIRYPMKGFSLDQIIDAFREIGWLFAQKIFPEDSIYQVPSFIDFGSEYYYQGRLIGWNTLEYFFVPKGMHTIEIRSNTDRESVQHTYFILADLKQRIFMDKEGEYARSLLQK